ncbi:MAG: hypothetical protein JSR63_12690 [Proteobacteria bacterium]|nr:hypothetical protein [Pseudomonadota bacterium]MBS0219017.1 hypothetical protein [Pseudomonadota bacterium]
MQTRSFIHPELVLLLRRALLGGLALVALLPAARGSNAWLGWMPLWLVLMPACALWVAEGLPLPRLATLMAHRGGGRRVQARRLRA